MVLGWQERARPNGLEPQHRVRTSDHDVRRWRTREFYQIGISANTTGISVYIMGLDDKTYLAETYGSDLGKASVTAYCIKFSALRNINLDVLEAAVRDGMAQAST